MNKIPSISNQFGIIGSNIVLDLPSYGGFFEKGIFSAIGQGLVVFITILVIVWVGFSLYGGYSIISSLGDTQKIEKGWKTIKSVWIGITYFLLFFAVISLVGVFVGIGAPWNWVDNLQQCASGGPASGRFYFQGKVEGGKRISYMQMASDFRKANPSAVNMYVLCCKNGEKQYIDVVRFSSSPPSGCSVNSSKSLGGVPSSTCKGAGSRCSSDADCCGGLSCMNSGGGMKCAP